MKKILILPIILITAILLVSCQNATIPDNTGTTSEATVSQVDNNENLSSDNASEDRIAPRTYTLTISPEKLPLTEGDSITNPGQTAFPADLENQTDSENSFASNSTDSQTGSGNPSVPNNTDSQTGSGNPSVPNNTDSQTDSKNSSTPNTSDDQDISLEETPLPALYISTYNGQAITSKYNYVSGNMIINDKEYSLNIRGRGNTSWRFFSPKSYLIKLDEKASLFGMIPSKKWALVSTGRDSSLIRNCVAMDIASYMDHLEYTPAQTPVDVYLNDTYLGVYTFSEKIEVGMQKVNMFSGPDYYLAENKESDGSEAAATNNKSPNINSNDTSKNTAVIDKIANNNSLDANENDNSINSAENEHSPDAKTSLDVPFFLECGGDLGRAYKRGQEYIATPHSPNMYFIYPEFDEPYTEEYKFVNDYMNELDRSLVKGEDYEDYIDVDSWVDWFIVMELTNNTDSAFWRSSFLYRRPGEKVKLGPVWDFDLAFGTFWNDNKSYAYWATAEQVYDLTQDHYMSYLYKSDDFMLAVRKRWDEKKEGLLKTAMDSADRHAAEVAPSRAKHNQATGTYGSDSQVQAVKKFIQKRYDWIDKSIHMDDFNRHPAPYTVSDPPLEGEDAEPEGDGQPEGDVPQIESAQPEGNTGQEGNRQPEGSALQAEKALPEGNATQAENRQGESEQTENMQSE